MSGLGAGGEVLGFRAPSHLQRFLSQCWETKHLPPLCNGGPSPPAVIADISKMAVADLRGIFHSFVPHLGAVSCCPLAGARAGARGAPVPWLVHKCTGRALSSAGLMLAIGHVQMCSACDLFRREPKVSTNFTSVPLRAILKVKNIFFPMFPCMRLGKLSN